MCVFFWFEWGVGVKFEGVGDCMNVVGLKIGFGGSIVDWFCFVLDLFCERRVGGFVDIGVCIGFDFF